MAKDPLADLRKDLAADPGESVPSRDPYARMIERVTPILDKAGMLGAPEGYLRQAGGLLIPQTSLGAATALALSPLPGGLAARAGLGALAERLAARSLPALAARTGLTAAATAGVGKLTGYDPVESGLMGAAGRLGGEAVGAAAKALVQSNVTKKMFGQMTSRVADTFRDIIGPWVEGDSPQAVIRDVLADKPSQRVGAAINTLRQKYSTTWVPVLDLEPELQAAGVTHTWKAGPSAGPGRVSPETVKAGTVWPPVREFESKLGPGTDVRLAGTPKQIGAGTTAMIPPERGMVPFGSIDADVSGQIDLVSKLEQKGLATRDDVVRKWRLEDLRLKIASRVDAPDMSGVLREYARTKTLRNWLWGKGTDPDTVVEELLDARTGNLTQQGIADLTKRLIAEQPRMSTLRPDEVLALQHALNWDLAFGGARSASGRGLSALMPGMSWWGAIPHFYWHGKTPTPGFVPAWEAARSPVQRVGPAALTSWAATIPTKLMPPEKEP